MNADALGHELNQLLTLETRSLVRHLAEATPYLDARTFKIWHDMTHMNHVSQDHAARLCRLMVDLDLTVETPGFESSVANYHDVTLSSLLPTLVHEKINAIETYERALAHAGGNDRVRSELQALLNENRQHLDMIESHQAVLSHA